MANPLFFIERTDKMKIYFAYKDEKGEIIATSADQIVKLPSLRFVYVQARNKKEAIKKARKIYEIKRKR